MEKKPMQPAIYQDVANEYKAQEGQSYNEIKSDITNEYERRCAAYFPDKGVWAEDVDSKLDEFFNKRLNR